MRAVVLHPDRKVSNATRSAEDALIEIVSLTEAISLEVVGAEIIPLTKPMPATLFGKGTVERLAEELKATEIDVLIVNHTLSPIQQRNLEKDLQVKVIDRTGLILEIFGERAATREGQLQVELAHLTYQRSRLVRSWTHLERQRGGFGFLGGPGESQLEIDRRLIDTRIVKISAELKQVRRTRGLHRQNRERSAIPVVALVGYTNAGKSTLFNALSGAGVLAKDMLFATLDPTMRSVELSKGRKIILSDTVGFIADLPTHLVESFRATLEEVQNADLILHVRDIAHPDTDAQSQDVLSILASLNIAGDDDRLLEVWNKIDLLPADQQQTLINQTTRRRQRQVAIAAGQGYRLDVLKTVMETALFEPREDYVITLDYAEGAALAWLYAHGVVSESKTGAKNIKLTVGLTDTEHGQFMQRFGR